MDFYIYIIIWHVQFFIGDFAASQGVGVWCQKRIKDELMLRSHSLDAALCALLWKPYPVGTLKHHCL